MAETGTGRDGEGPGTPGGRTLCGEHDPSAGSNSPLCFCALPTVLRQPGLFHKLSVSCLIQTLFALNDCYWMNEKGAVALASAFPLTPPRLAERINASFQKLAPSRDALTLAIAELAQLGAETAELLAQVSPAT